MTINNNKKYRDILLETVDKKYRKRMFVNKLVTITTVVCVIAAIVPLTSILIEVVRNGISAISYDFLTQPQGSIGSGSGGIAPAIQGTFIVVGLAAAIGTPVGLLTGIYLSEFAKEGKFSYAVRFFNDVLTGLPSIVIGIVGYVLIVLALGSFSVLAGALSLSIIMIPIVVRVTEETLKVVPYSLREAGHSLGLSKAKITLFIVLPAAKDGILTGIVVAISRIAGETAPLIMTILGTSLFFTGITGPVDALPLRIWRLASQPYESAHAFGWGSALVLILMILALSMGLRLLVQKRSLRPVT
ncbi:MAG: phosphate ABC transporter permease PstA [Thaumarchaeota archaeon]|nr:MAG: phosphate ABC transporter permease PstA [Nitrososphaerota archaeon]TLX87359.1 MAG: phosphate ABC transporter permease PstA [Nitrososphaerota archaeon]